jgi:hypothetical protein
MFGRLRPAVISVILLGIAGGPARAEDAADGLQVHAFVSQGALITTDNNYLAKTERGSLEFTEAGINFTKPLDDRLTTGIQLFARDLGPDGNYDAQLDWLYLDYRWRDWLGLRAGRVKVPFGLYNDTSDVDAAQPVVLLPQSVYPAANRQFLLAQTGVELYGYLPIHAAGSLSYHAFGGTLHLSIPSTAEITVRELDVPYVAGAQVLWETPVDGLRLGVSGLAAALDASYQVVTTPPLPAGTVEVRAKEWLASAEYADRGFVLAAELGRTITKSSFAGMTSTTTSQQLYGLASYHWTPTWQTTAYYSLLYRDVDHHSAQADHQHDAALSLRIDLSPHWLFKLEGHLMRGTAALTSQLNDGRALSELTNQWWLFAAKTTVYF